MKKQAQHDPQPPGSGSPSAPEVDSGEPRIPGSDGGLSHQADPTPAGTLPAEVDGDNRSKAAGAPAPAASPFGQGPPLQEDLRQASEWKGSFASRFARYGEISRYPDVFPGGGRIRLLVETGSRLNQELENAWMCHLLGEDGDLFVEEAYIGRVVDWFDDAGCCRFSDRIEWLIEDVDTTTSGNTPWWKEPSTVEESAC